jgi:hypothetical protein
MMIFLMQFYLTPGNRAHGAPFRLGGEKDGEFKIRRQVKKALPRRLLLREKEKANNLCRARRMENNL